LVSRSISTPIQRDAELLSPSCRLARLMVAEKRVACDPVLSDDPKRSMPVLVDLDGTQAEGVWAILDHLLKIGR